jgi:hypothetical protein
MAALPGPPVALPAGMTARATPLLAAACLTIAPAAVWADLGAERPRDAGDGRAFAEYRRRLDALLASEAHDAAAPEGGPGCRLGDVGSRLDARTCLGCHGAHEGHPVDLDYAVRASLRRGDLRPAGEVVARGVFLPDGFMRCQSCHDARSPWKHRVAIPPGAAARPAVNPRVLASYAGPRSGLPVQPGEAVTPTPLCQACHTIGD